jgi:hypothetical protein
MPIDMFGVPPILFRLLCGLLVLGRSKQEHLWLVVTAHPTAERIARQLTDACGWSEAPRYHSRSRPWQHFHLEFTVWVYGAARSHGDRFGKMDPRIGASDPSGVTALDHVVILSEQRLRHLLPYAPIAEDAPIPDGGARARLAIFGGLRGTFEFEHIRRGHEPASIRRRRRSIH